MVNHPYMVCVCKSPKNRVYSISKMAIKMAYKLGGDPNYLLKWGDPPSTLPQTAIFVAQVNPLRRFGWILSLDF